jgi:hypothetical protein
VDWGSGSCPYHRRGVVNYEDSEKGVVKRGLGGGDGRLGTEPGNTMCFLSQKNDTTQYFSKC